MRVGFLFNHYFPHQVPHAAPYAFELSRLYPDIDVIVACSSRQEMDLVEAIGALYPGHRCQFRMLTVPSYFRLIDPVVSLWAFARKRAVLRHNLPLFRGWDALVSPERNCLDLRTVYGLQELIMIRTRHGAGDRDGVFDARLRGFQFMLLPGQKYVDRLRALGLLQEGSFCASGYPKFEVVRGLNRKIPQLFDNDNPIVVYNPHFDRSQSSWGPMGLRILEWFLHHREFNLIFAPHVVLFKRCMRHGAFLPGKYRRVPNIHVDTGSSASIDMTYLQAADVYLGEVSSQVYEFLLEPRPCIFLNGHHVAWQDNPSYQHWRLGQVVENIEAELMDALNQAFATHPLYIDRQREAFAYAFTSEPETTAAERGARAIADFLHRNAGPFSASPSKTTTRGL